MKTRFIFNPKSGRNARDPSILNRALRYIEDGTLKADLVFTQRPRHGTELARQAVADGCELVVAIGGDGTMNEVAAGIVGTTAIFGLVPCGSGNGLGRHLGIPGPGRGAFRTLLSGKPRLIDTATVNGIPFFNAMGLGFDAEISHRFNQLSRRGLPAYVRTTLRTFFGYSPQHYEIRNGVSSFSGKGFIIAVSNSDQYGNDCFIAPGARVDDGELNVTLLPPVGIFNGIDFGIRLFTKRIAGGRGVKVMKGCHFVIERREPGLIHTDGETHETGAVLDIQVVPKSLRVMAPAV